MAITSGKLRSLPVSHTLREALVKVNAGGSAATDVLSAHISGSEKLGLLALRAGTATRAGINALPIDLPTKAALLDAAGV